MDKKIECPFCYSKNTAKFRTIPAIARSISSNPLVEPKFDYWIYICKNCNKQFNIKEE